MLVERLQPDEQGSTLEAKQALDAQLAVNEWSLPWQRQRISMPTRPALVNGYAPPAWWVDDEDASQSFFTGMGMTPNV